LLVLFVVWLAGVLIHVYWPLQSYLESRRLRAKAVILPDASLRVLVGHSPKIRTPMLAGIFRPMVLLPADIGSWANAEEQRAIVLHEVAHFERRDHLVNLFQTLVGAVLFFHPAVRYALRQLTIERELACDERVLGAGAEATAYAEALLKVAERAISRRESYEPAFNTSGKTLDRRMTMILNYRPSSLHSPRLGSVLRAAAVCGVAFLLLPERMSVPESLLSLPVLVAAVPATSFAQAPVPQPPSIVVAQAVVPGTIPGQVQTGSLSGTVLDQSGAVIPGVSVRIFNSTTGFDRTTITNERGAYSFPQINVGQYTFEARLPGFANHSRTTSIRAQAEVLDAVLQLGRIETVLEVIVAAPQAAPPPAVPAQTPLRVGGAIAVPNLIYAPKPVYPAAAFAKLAQDSVKLDAVVDKDGAVQSVQVNPLHGTSSPALIQAAIDAVRQWRYRPALLNGTSVEFPVTVTVNFMMQ
jgi:TonB family protein